MAINTPIFLAKSSMHYRRVCIIDACCLCHNSQVEEFSTEVDTSGFCFPPTGVIVIWKWNWLTSGYYETDNVQRNFNKSGNDREDSASDTTVNRRLIDIGNNLQELRSLCSNA